MEARIGKSFKKVKAFIYKNCQNGFYVYAKPSLHNHKDVIKYIGRYLGRPVIATSRIDCYDGTSVTFHYNRHEDGKLITETVPAVASYSRGISWTSVVLELPVPPMMPTVSPERMSRSIPRRHSRPVSPT